MPYREVLTAWGRPPRPGTRGSPPAGGRRGYVRPGLAGHADVRGRRSRADRAGGEQGWRLAILTNCDDDLFAATRSRLPAPFDMVVTAQQVGSYNGIANVTVLTKGREPVAFDIGPANALVDAVVTSLSGGRERFDENGRRGGRGHVDPGLLATVARRVRYYLWSAPKSTEKELSNL